MPPRLNPTARQVRLGAELRKMREAAGVTAREAAKILGSGPTQVSHVEAGRFGVSEERIRRLAEHCACDDPAYVNALVAMATERGKGWWDDYRGLIHPSGADLAELEHNAIDMRVFEVAHIPGLFQTEDHMRAAFRYMSPDWTQQELDTFIGFRRSRQHVITGMNPTPYEAVIHEAALRLRVGGRKTARAQLDKVLSCSEAPNITVRVVPFANEDFAGPHSMLYARGPVSQLDTVHLDTGHGGVFVSSEPDLSQYRHGYQLAEATSLTPQASRDLITRIMHEL